MSKVNLLASTAVALIAVATVSLPALSDDEGDSLKLTTAIQLPGPVTNFDISYVGVVQRKYYLGHRDVAAIDILDILTNKVTKTPSVFTNGPNGVWVVNDSEVWGADAGSQIRVFDGLTGAVKGPPVMTGGSGRVDEGCFDPADQLVVAANNQEAKGQLFVSLIWASGPNAHKVAKKITLDGSPSSGTVLATNGIEQCAWSPFTGKIYVDVPEDNGPGNDTAPGVIMVIDPKTMTVETNIPVPIHSCDGPMGLAVGLPNQLLAWL
jgi:hypothetical protein